MQWWTFAIWIAQLLIMMRALSRFGYSPIWAAATIIPLASIIGVWFLALKRWPIPDAKELGKTARFDISDTFA